MIITNPVTTTVAQPYLQLQGCSPERLQSVTFDLSNAVVVLTNQPGVLTGRFLDTNLLSFTTNCFQCFDIPITNALNRITLHATDLAGNVTTTNLNITLDYSLATNPVIRLTWPTNGMQICGSSFTLRGWTEDASAIVTAQIMDTNGGTNVMSGTVERTGVLWVENLPLAEGTNIVTLWVTNSAGLSGKTNICVVKSDMTLTLNSISGSLWLPTVDVNGSISDPTAAVWVNGVQGTNHGDGTWSASGVPVSPGCVASFDMTASPAGGDDPSASANVDKAAEIVMESATWNGNSTYNTDAGVGGGWEVDKVQGNFKAMLGGSQTEHFEEQDSNRVAFVVWDKTDTIGPNKNITLEHDTGYNDWTSWDYYCTDVGSITIEQEQGALSVQNLFSTPNVPLDELEGADVCMVLHTGGKSLSKLNNLFKLAASAGERVVAAGVSYDGQTYSVIVDGPGVPSTEITVAGYHLDTNGVAWAVFPDGASVDCTPDTFRPLYKFTVGQAKYTPFSHTLCQAPADTNWDRTTIGVGEMVNLGFDSPPPATLDWTTSSGYLSAPTGSGNQFTAPDTLDYCTITAKVRDSEASIKFCFSVIPPDGVEYTKYGGDRHLNGYTSAGFLAFVQILPLSVSFYAIQVKEDSAPAVNTSGVWTNSDAHLPGPWRLVNSDNTLNPYADQVASKYFLPGAFPGGYTWAIPWRYCVPTENQIGYVFDTLYHRFGADTDGTAVQSKNGVTTAGMPLNAPTDWPF